MIDDANLKMWLRTLLLELVTYQVIGGVSWKYLDELLEKIS